MLRLYSNRTVDSSYSAARTHSVRSKRALLCYFMGMLAGISLLYAKDIVYTGQDGLNRPYKLAFSYSEDVRIGDAVFIYLDYTGSSSIPKVTASLKCKDKLLAKAQLYSVGEQSLLVGLPVNAWQVASKASIELKCILSTKELDFTLPLSFKDRDFIKETVQLDEANTAIKTDTSTARNEQIKRLNSVLFSVDSSSVYQVSPFSLPLDTSERPLRHTAYFGDRRIYAYSTGKSSTSMHYGNDYGVPKGTLVHACARGKVVLAENRVTTGYSCVIEHLPGLYSLYYHMDSLKAKVGDIVAAGDTIGYSGSTGLATGPHLHWEMRLLGEAVCPEYFLTSFNPAPKQ